jgi:hypothetical protein
VSHDSFRQCSFGVMGELRAEASGADEPAGLKACRVTIRWRPTLNVFDGRIKLLQVLDGQKRLRAFKVDAEDARGMTSNGIEFAITPNRISIAAPGNLLENDDFAALLEATLDEVKPRVTHLHVRLQHLQEIVNQRDYSLARKTAVRNVFSPAIHSLGLTDTAVLVDGSIPGRSLRYSAEFGIVDESEARTRLTDLSLGRLPESEDGSLGSAGLAEKLGVLPQVGLYIDSHWDVEQKIPNELSTSWLLEHFETVFDSAASFARQVLAITSEGNNPKSESAEG